MELVTNDFGLMIGWGLLFEAVLIVGISRLADVSEHSFLSSRRKKYWPLLSILLPLTGTIH